MENALIAAMAANRVIGADNRIPWHIPGELQRFKEVTWGHSLLMGRRTFVSIGHPLPGRRNIVVTRNRSFQAVGCEIVHSLEEGLDLCKEETRVFNIGGAELFRLGLKQADTIILTVLDREFEGDALFPEFSATDFTLTATERVEGPLPYTIRTYRRCINTS
jgi:dihydrofolate reductase